MKTDKQKILLLFSMIAVHTYGQEADAVLTVGPIVQGCTHDTIQAAVDASDPGEEVRITSVGSPYIGSINIGSHGVSLKGGYLDCIAANADTESDTKPIIKANNPFNSAITVDNPSGEVVFESMIVQDSDNGFDLKSNFPVTLSNIDISTNTIGVLLDQYAEGSNELNINYTLIESNSLSGISCLDQDSVVNIHNSEVKNHQIVNEAYSTLDFRSGCRINAQDSSIHDNSNVAGGGALRLEGGSVASLRNVVFQANQANSDGEGLGNGGAILATSGSNISAVSTCFIDNSASNGGAVALDGASFTASRGSQKSGCHKYQNNRASNQGGVFFVGFASSAILDSAVVQESRADQSIVATVIVGSYFGIINSLITNNGDSGSGDWADESLFGVALLGFGSTLDIWYSTIADNNITDIIIDDLNGAVDVKSSIISDQVDVIQTVTSNNDNFECLIAHENQSYSSGSATVTDPLFKDRANGDFSLTATSPAIDYCYEAIQLNTVGDDYEADLRGVDHPGVADFLGPFDLGFNAFNHRILFRNGFDSCEL